MTDNCNFHLNYIGVFTASNGHPVIILQGVGCLCCKFTVISYLLPSLTPILHPLYNILLFRGHYPMVWKRAMGLMILKPKKKKSDPGSFRPISLLCNLGKVLESIVTTRLYSWAESTNLLPPEQSGFRKKRSVNDRLFQLTDRCATICQTPNSTFRGNLPRRREGV